MSEVKQANGDTTPRRPSHFDRHASSKPPPLPTSPISATPASPRTPLFGRSISGNILNSPGSLFRTDDEVHVLELGSRYLRVGFGGEAQPRASMTFGPEIGRRPDDYTPWLPDKHGGLLRERRRRPWQDEPGDWGMDHALFPLDLRGCELGLISDKIMRAMREAVISHLLVIDDRRRGLMLVVPPLIPHPLLSAALQTLFSNFPNPQQITLLSTSLCATVAAGLRNALVIDFGYHETAVTAISELKEIATRRSERGMRRLNWEVSKMLMENLDTQHGSNVPGVVFEDCEEVMWRMCWCRKTSRTFGDSIHQEEDDPIIEVSLQSQDSQQPIPIPFSTFSQPVEATFFTSPSPPQSIADSAPTTVATSPVPPQPTSSARPPPTSSLEDDHVTTLPLLIYLTLLALPIDIRCLLLPRILIAGGGSHIPGLKSRLLSELSELIRLRGWTPVNSYGSVTNKPRPKPRRSAQKRTKQKQDGPTTVPEEVPSPELQSTRAAQPQGSHAAGFTSTSTIPAASTTPTATPVQEQQSQQPEQPQLPTAPQPQAVPAAIVPTSPRNKDMHPSSKTPAHAQPPLPDPFLVRIHRSSPLHNLATTSATPHPRLLTTLGSWTGASILTGLRQNGLVEIDRDIFLAHGLNGADRSRESTVLVEGEAKRRSREQENKRVSVLAGKAQEEKGERKGGNWTLGAWA